MRSHHNAPIIFSALAGGLLAGSLMAAKRPRPVSSRALVRIDAPQALPARVYASQPAIPVIYEAHLVPSAPRRWVPWLLVMLAVLAAGAISVVVTARPQISAAAPASFIAGSAGYIAYSASGNGSADVSVDSGSYHHSQPISAREGTIAIPPAVTHPGVDVLATFHMRGWFGVDTRSLRVRVSPPPAPITRMVASNAPVIRHLTLSRTAVHGGEPVVASYDTNAPAGMLQLVDAEGVIWQSRAVSGRGVLRLTAPRMHADTPFIIVLQARRGGQSTTASAGFIAKGVPSADALANANTAQDSVRADEARFVLPSILRSGATIAIPVSSAFSGVTVGLSAPDGTPLAEPAQQHARSVVLHVPVVQGAQAAFATLSYQRGKGRETVIRRLTIVP